MEEYLGLKAGGVGEIVEKKSRFIGYVEPVEDEAAANAFIEKIKKKHHDARHNCFAYSIGTGPQPLLRFSDDGEPQGTAGKPILEVIRGSEVKNICIVVTRYFGGVLLGTGGLVRAYTDAAKEGLAACEIHTFKPISLCKLCIAYPELKTIENLVKNMDARITDTSYTENVTLTIEVAKPQYADFVKKITDLSGGNLKPTHLEDRFG